MLKKLDKEPKKQIELSLISIELPICQDFIDFFRKMTLNFEKFTENCLGQI